jgi:hypothetical protein
MKNYVTEKKSLIKVVVIVAFVGVFINYGIWTPHRSTPEKAIKAYL